MTGDNYGVQHSGGTSHVGVQAVGTGARAVAGDVTAGVSGPSLAELLATVRSLVSEHAEELPSSAGTTVEILDEELTQEEPSGGVVMRLIDRLTKLVTPVEPVANAVEELSKAAQAALG